MIKGYLACCEYFVKGLDPEKDALHSFTVFSDREKAIEDLRKLYDEQKEYVLDELDLDDSINEDLFDQESGTFNIRTELRYQQVHGFISTVDIVLN